MEREKVKEIKTALSSIKELKLQTEEQETPFIVLSMCDCLDYINELENKNERLLEQRNKTYNIWVKDTKQLKDRIAELEKEKTCVWEEWTDGDHSIWCCSNCKEDFCFIEGDVYENNYGYCPHCGAKITALKEMKEDEIDETLKEFI